MNLGIAGAGKIVPEFLEAQKEVEGLCVIGICATKRSIERQRELAKAYQITTVYDDYETMLSAPEIEAVYVAVPNHLHASFTRQALEHGKSVICEKPFCVHLEEAQELEKLAEEKGLFLFEAITNQYLPNYQKVKELLSRVGKVHMAELNFSQYSSRYDAFKRGELPPVFDPEKAGGALMDLNVYNIHFAVGLFGKPQQVCYTANRERGVDTSGVLLLKYPDFSCVLIAAKDSHGRSGVNIQGEKGCIAVKGPSSMIEQVSFYGADQKTETYELNGKRHRMYYELLAFSNMVKEKDMEKCRAYGKQTLAVQEVLERAKALS